MNAFTFRRFNALVILQCIRWYGTLPGGYLRLPDDTALLQQLVRDLASVLRQTAELDESKARPAARDAEIEKLQLPPTPRLDTCPVT